MKKTQALFVTVLIALAAIPALASTVVAHSKYQDETARAEYSWIEGCLSNRLEISAALTKVKHDGTPEPTSMFFVIYSVQNFCNGQLTFWYGESSTVSIAIDNTLRSARAVSPAFAITQLLPDGQGGVINGPTINLVVDIRWSSDDPLDKYKDTVVTNYPGFHSVTKLTGRYRLATATGILSDGVRNWIPVAPEGSFAQMFSLSGGETTVTKE